ncbi:hypothetical protein NIVACYA_00521 [Planktothrix agardhii]|jgi:hypothetical protein|uniref:Uncharacterized protein n=1 Tax=Planktothrix agardhii TaxID=1160 RepID=A0AAD1Q2B9_PLAAG|nr:hypothetical protein NIVACYA_00521 [Planktothrix agardhii]BBD54269.1 hypothetical protein NIES204_15590 [Planktothrix agardhii NIES-204]CAD5926491.1 hypothetical protein PANO66_01044 [Planktothrix agardhii]CAD5930872.1 hypothetical protein NO2A_01727 [Planktothrix agardhii]CAD5933827.1 hypothetical protein PCC7811_01477 [Planktothrix agardhii]
MKLIYRGRYDTTYSPQSQATQDLLGYVCQAGS